MIDFEFDFRYEGEKIPALKNVQGEIGNGKCIVLCGRSGCGKSTLLRCINHLIPQFYEGNLKGFCRIQGRDTGELSVGEVGRLAASVFQDPRSQFFTINSTTEVAFGMENHGVPREEMVEKVEAAFGLFSLEKLKDRNVYELSSGERQLISILSAWAVDTDVLLLDEPTANLDFAAIKQLRELLLKLKGQGKTLILSEHRLYYLSGIADELLADGRRQAERGLPGRRDKSHSEGRGCPATDFCIGRHRFFGEAAYRNAGFRSVFSQCRGAAFWLLAERG